MKPLKYIIMLIMLFDVTLAMADDVWMSFFPSPSDNIRITGDIDKSVVKYVKVTPIDKHSRKFEKLLNKIKNNEINEVEASIRYKKNGNESDAVFVYDNYDKTLTTTVKINGKDTKMVISNEGMIFIEE